MEYKLREYKYLLKAVEFQQEAHYQDPWNKSWSDLDLYQVHGFGHFLLKSRFISVHLRAKDCDIACHLNDGHRHWSALENGGGIKFGFDIGANCLAAHPGSWPNGVPWPSVADSYGILRKRADAFRRSLSQIVPYFVDMAHKREMEAEKIQGVKPSFYARLSQGLAQLQSGELEDLDYYRQAHEVMEMIIKEKVPVWLVRRLGGTLGPRICLENVEPPNFLIGTPAQLSAWNEELTHLFHDEWKKQGLSYDWWNRYKPMMLVDVNHFLNTQFIMTNPQNHAYGHCFPDYDDLFRKYVALPQEGGNEALLNRFVNKNRDNIAYFHLAAGEKRDDWIATHEPIKAFRTQMYMILSARGLPVPKYATGSFDPQVELNLEEVLQLLGPSITAILEVFDCSSEQVRSSQINVQAFCTFMGRETNRVGRLVLAKAASPYFAEFRKKMKDALYYMVPYQGDERWKVGYSTGAFYHDDGTCLAEYDDETGKVFLRISDSFV